MKSILILEDQYTKSIYEWLHSIFPEYYFPITTTIKTPMDYAALIDEADIILLDNYFPWKSWWEEPLGCEVLEYIVTRDIQKKIICISDFQQKLLEKYDIWNTAYNKWMIYWFPSKEPKDIAYIIQHI
jgi:response regulator of citrate/malate metabolism